MVLHTLQISTLLFPKPRTRLLHPRCKRDLDILRHHLVALAHTARLLSRLPDHHLDLLHRLLALVEPVRDLLRQPLNGALLLLPGLLITKPGEQMLLVQLVQPGGLLRDVGQQLRHLLLHVHPTRREQVHLDHGVAVIFETAGDQPAPLLRYGWGI